MELKKYRFLEHTADIMFEAYGKSYGEALENAALAMFSVIGRAKEEKSAKFSMSAHNIEELTVQALADLLAYMDTHGVVFSRISVGKFDMSKPCVSLVAYGEEKAPDDHVKAVTYHEIMVKEEKGKWTIRILLDV